MIQDESLFTMNWIIHALHQWIRAEYQFRRTHNAAYFVWTIISSSKNKTKNPFKHRLYYLSRSGKINSRLDQFYNRMQHAVKRATQQLHKPRTNSPDSCFCINSPNYRIPIKQRIRHPYELIIYSKWSVKEILNNFKPLSMKITRIIRSCYRFVFDIFHFYCYIL